MMKLKRAIEILELDKTCDFEGESKDLEDAVQLGIEALKRIKLDRLNRLPFPSLPLPSETPEDKPDANL